MRSCVNVSWCVVRYFLINTSVIFRTDDTYALITLSLPSAPMAATPNT